MVYMGHVSGRATNCELCSNGSSQWVLYSNTISIMLSSSPVNKQVK